jgi:hypothetical protein
MTFAVVLTQDNQPRIVGTLFADNEHNAQALAPQLWNHVTGGSVSVCRTEDREIPLKLAATEPTIFC